MESILYKMKIKKFKDWLVESAQINKTSIDNTGGYIYPPVAEEDESNYMFFSNLRRIQELAKMLLAMDKEEMDKMLNQGHDWANDHITTAKTNLEHVFGFFKDELGPISDSKITESVHDTTDLHRQYSMDPTWWSAWRAENEKEKGLKIEKDSFSKTYEVKDKDDKVIFVYDYRRNKIFTNETPSVFTLKDEMSSEEMAKAKEKSDEIKDDLAGVDKEQMDKDKADAAKAAKDKEGGENEGGGDQEEEDDEFSI